MAPIAVPIESTNNPNKANECTTTLIAILLYCLFNLILLNIANKYTITNDYN